MAKLTVEEVLDKKYVTDAGLAHQLAKGELTLDDQIIKDHVYQTGAYIAIYGSDDEEPAEALVTDPDEEPKTKKVKEPVTDPDEALVADPEEKI